MYPTHLRLWCSCTIFKQFCASPGEHGIPARIQVSDGAVWNVMHVCADAQCAGAAFKLICFICTWLCGMFGHFESAAHLPTILCVCIFIFTCPPMLSGFMHVFGMLAQLLDSTWSCIPEFNGQVAHFRDFLTCTDGFRSVYSRVHAVVNTWNVPVPTWCIRVAFKATLVPSLSPTVAISLVSNTVKACVWPLDSKRLFFNFRDPLWRSGADGYCHEHAGTQIVTQILTCKHLGAWSAVGYPIPMHFTSPNPNPPPLLCPRQQLAPSAMTSSLSATITSQVLIPSVLARTCQPSMTFLHPDQSC